MLQVQVGFVFFEVLFQLCFTRQALFLQSCFQISLFCLTQLIACLTCHFLLQKGRFFQFLSNIYSIETRDLSREFAELLIQISFVFFLSQNNQSNIAGGQLIRNDS